MATQASPLDTTPRYPKQSIRAESRMKMSEALRRKAMSPKMRAAVVGKKTPLSSVGSDTRTAAPSMVEGASLPVSPHPGDQTIFDEFEMEQDDGLQQLHQQLSGIESGFKAEIFSLTEKINIAQAENARLKTIENEAHKALKACEDEKQDLNDQLRDAQADKKALQSSATIQEIHFSVLRREHERLETNLSHFEFENERLRSNIEEINEEMDSLKADYDSLQDIRYTELPNLQTKLEETTCAKDEVTSIVTAVTEQFRCGICLSTLKKPVVLSCHHMFCREDLVTWRSATQTDGLGYNWRKVEYSCPTCRSRTRIGYDISKLYGFKNLLEIISDHDSVG